MKERGLAWPVLCLLTVILWTLAVSADLIAWAAPNVGPLGQTVPTVTPVRPQPSTPTTSEEPTLPAASVQPPVGTATSAVRLDTPAPGTPAASAQPPVGGAQPSFETPTQPPPALTPTREAAPAAVWQPAETAGAAPPELPASQQCAPAITPAAAVSLPPVFDSSGPASLAWLALLGVGTMLVGLGLVLISRKDD